MNPLVRVAGLQQPEGDPFAEATLANYNVVILVDASLDQIQRADEACRKCNTAFYAASARGTCSFLFADLCNHVWTPQVHLSGSPAAACRPASPLAFSRYSCMHPTLTYLNSNTTSCISGRVGQPRSPAWVPYWVCDPGWCLYW